MEIENLLEKVKKGDDLALARAISIVENSRKGCDRILQEAFLSPGRAIRVGITGAPGSGKSSLVARLISHIRRRGKSVAVMAIDPSSPLSGGAILGDRIRMNHLAGDGSVFIRSLASRGHLGGLSSAASKVLPLFDCAGKEIVLIETVGVGQSETEIMEIADLTTLILNPQAGDEIQILKAGIMEIADIYVINKSDLDGAQKQMQDLKAFFALSNINPPALMTSARNDEGIDALLDTIIGTHELHATRNREKQRSYQKKLVKRVVLEKIEQLVERSPSWKNYAPDTENPFAVADEIYRRITNDKKD